MINLKKIIKIVNNVDNILGLLDTVGKTTDGSSEPSSSNKKKKKKSSKVNIANGNLTHKG